MKYGMKQGNDYFASSGQIYKVEKEGDIFSIGGDEFVYCPCGGKTKQSKMLVQYL